jgi:hypothetical protein
VLGAGCRRILIEGGIPIMAIGHVFFGGQLSLVPCTTSKLPNYQITTRERKIEENSLDSVLDIHGWRTEKKKRKYLN